MEDTKMSSIRFTFVSAFLSMLIVFSMNGPVAAANFNLTAAAGVKVMPDGRSVPFWGFGLNGAAPTSPGPVLRTTPGDTVTISVTNGLTVPISISITGLFPGRTITPIPVRDTTSAAGLPAKNRVLSFSNQVSPGATVTYPSFTVTSGTYLYESGTNPATQVNMGLFGALVVAPATGTGNPAVYNAYTPTATNTQTGYNRDEVLVFSDILARYDAALRAYVTLNEDVLAGTFASSLNYVPLYYLINGKSFPDTIVPDLAPPAGVPAGTPGIYAPIGQRTLLRMVNASGHNYVPSIRENYLTLIAEDGNLYPYAKSQFSVTLPAGKTVDAILDLPQGTAVNYYALYDRRLGLSNATAHPGGMMIFLASWGASQNCSPMKGDVNGDGIITVVDALTVLRAFVNSTGLIAAGDVYDATSLSGVSSSGLPCGDGSMTLADALWLLQKAVGINPY
jgi:FtsP/CotA-like multicopper oxidase with cupredoxin domain